VLDELDDVLWWRLVEGALADVDDADPTRGRTRPPWALIFTSGTAAAPKR